MVGGDWRLAVGGWRRLAAVGGGWQLVMGGWWRLAAVDGSRLVAGGGWRRLVVGGWWRLAVWWQLAVRGWWSLGGVLKGGPLQKKSGPLRTALPLNSGMLPPPTFQGKATRDPETRPPAMHDRMNMPR